MEKLEKVMEALDKVIRLPKKTARPKISITYGDIDERELKIVNKLATMTREERMLVRWIFCHFRMVVFHSVALLFTEIQVVQSSLCTFFFFARYSKNP